LVAAHSPGIAAVGQRARGDPGLGGRPVHLHLILVMQEKA